MAVRVRAVVGEGDNVGVLVFIAGIVIGGVGVPVASCGFGTVVIGGTAVEQAARKSMTRVIFSRIEMVFMCQGSMIWQF